MILYSQALGFLTDKLGITDAERRLQTDRADLLDEIVLRYQNAIPFHNLFMMILSRDEKRIPTLEENIQSVLSCQGGMCWTLNSAMCVLLKALGYNAFPTLSSVNVSGPNENDHCVTIVRDLVNLGDQHLVEAGLGGRTSRAIPLDFEGESREYDDAHSTYKFVKRGGYIIRMHKTHPGRKFFITEGEWGQVNYFKPEPCEWDTIKSAIDSHVYSNVDNIFNKMLKVWVLQDNKIVSLRNDNIQIESSEYILVRTYFEEGQIVSKIVELVPQISKEVIESAFKAWLIVRPTEIATM